ncbi:MAG TPA: class I SAM-dependent methyltransferase [Salinimicrobium sp.]|nr:class I SAM-dependent methyltransferase [Salinimicrobium sp.]
MSKKLWEEEVKNIAAQLRCPEGKMGIKVANTMNQTNIGMTQAGIEALKMKEDDDFLEIGHGNAAHLKEILNVTKNVTYRGLDISEAMHREAQKINSKFLETGRASFHLYEGQKIPFPDNAFDKIMTVNTIYFWKEPLHFMNEVYRVLKKGGRFAIGFVEKEFMKNLPVTKYGFELYGTQELEKLVQRTHFKIESIHNKTEQLKSKSGELVDRKFTIFCLVK